ncbi:TrmH family RNA methyltransferase [Cellulomonas bogoriensis]|uniref:RNA methyltransferase n=1 Tax=Cellulomonas bogoriensis 69B4 = DSM 16987 TaxID=1386082 RepID=A0A0A0BTJ7_9CELL|nr:RNA methyltransferase [Cellulomonas bogoriensis]KGM11250.1 RNA methyltransferase [Cellulomonas bogoriensis 69B4 = DSM 16987]
MSNPRAERVRAVRALAGRSARRRSGRFLVEGPQGVRELVHHRVALAREVYMTLEAQSRYVEIDRASRAAGVGVRTVTDEVMTAMSGDAQGVLAVADLAAVELTDLRRAGLVAVLANVRDPGNAGAVVRAADAAGADAVVVAGDSVDVHNPKVVRSTAGSMFHVPVVTGATVPQVLDHLAAGGLQLLAADGGGEHDLDDLQSGAERGQGPSLAAPTAWVFGNEAWGLTPEDRDRCDAAVRVPIHGLAESLNLATAAVLCLYASARCRRAVRHRCERPADLRP